MKKTLLTIFACIAAISGNAQQLNDYAIKVGDFNKLKISDNCNVVYTANPDSLGYAYFRGERDFADAFIFSNSNGTLKIQVNTEDVGKKGLPTVYVASRFLTDIESSSSMTVSVNTPAPCAVMKANLIGNGTLIVEGVSCDKAEASLKTGNGTLTISGTCRQANLSMLGTGTVQADMLKANEVKCRILGSGTIGCWPVENLSTSGIGSTKIYYKGNPVSIKKKGGGKLLRLESADAQLKDDGPEPGREAFEKNEQETEITVVEDD